MLFLLDQRNSTSFWFCCLFYANYDGYKIRPGSSCFGIMPLISYNNQGGSYRKLSNKSTQYDVRVFNTVIRTVVAEDNQKKKQTNGIGWVILQ